MTKNGFAGQSLGDQPALLLLRGKSGRSESPPADVVEAVNALMQAVHFPAAAFITTQVRESARPALLANTERLSRPNQSQPMRIAEGCAMSV